MHINILSRGFHVETLVQPWLHAVFEKEYLFNFNPLLESGIY